MQMLAEVEPDSDVVASEVSQTTSPPQWRLGTRIAFRFCFIYFTLYVLSTQMVYGLWILPFQMPSIGFGTALQAMSSWVATELYKFPKPLVLVSGSGDTPLDWSLATVLLAIAVVATALWSVIDRKRPAYDGLHKWYRVLLRYGLGTTMLTYGMMKAFPLQMPFPVLSRLVEPYGHFSLMGVLWNQIGASPAYETITGSVEVLSAILLFLPGLTLAGALVAFVAATQVFILNMTYDVPVKLFAFHLILFSLVLMAPDLKRLLNVIVLNRTAGPSPVPPLARSRVGRVLLIAVQLVLAAYLLGSSFSSYLGMHKTYGPGAPRPPLYGIWDVQRMTIDGVERAPLLTDFDRWRRVVIDYPGVVNFQRMDDTLTRYATDLDEKSKTMALNVFRRGLPAGPNPPPPQPAGKLTYQQPSPERLVLDGEMNGKKVRLELQNYDRNNFRLVTNGFNWVQDYPVNR